MLSMHHAKLHLTLVSKRFCHMISSGSFVSFLCDTRNKVTNQVIIRLHGLAVDVFLKRWANALEI
jgi:hypothetical protein